MRKQSSLVFTSKGCQGLLVPTMQLKLMHLTLAGVAQWIECRPVNQRVIGLIPSQVTCLDCRPGSPVRGMGGNHTLIFLSLSFSLPFSLSKNKFKKSFLKAHTSLVRAHELSRTFQEQQPHTQSCKTTASYEL